MKTHLLTVACTGGAERLRPRINFSGDWLYEIGFIPGALVQVIPEPGGLDFRLCDNNLNNYNDLFFTTRDMGGALLRVYLADGKTHKGAALVASGQYIYTGGLAMGDVLIAGYDYGVIRVRKVDPHKLGFENVMIITTTSIKRKYTNDLIPKVRLCGDWLGAIGFLVNSIATAASEQGVITLTLQENTKEYSALMKYVRGRKMKIIQVYEATHNRKVPCPCIGISGSCVDKAGFEIGENLAATYQHGTIKLQTLDFEKLGF